MQYYPWFLLLTLPLFIECLKVDREFIAQGILTAKNQINFKKLGKYGNKPVLKSQLSTLKSMGTKKVADIYNKKQVLFNGLRNNPDFEAITISDLKSLMQYLNSNKEVLIPGNKYSLDEMKFMAMALMGNRNQQLMKDNLSQEVIGRDKNKDEENEDELMDDNMENNLNNYFNSINKEMGIDNDNNSSINSSNQYDEL
ncbi:hypothetical protein K502DRAFT_330513 [Neoconidiobolus thromboides FSU 785]|nr:hypothetical protein K502DRAFT_330513 [Neoconidiobolus thromboides FSU 785]